MSISWLQCFNHHILLYLVLLGNKEMSFLNFFLAKSLSVFQNYTGNKDMLGKCEQVISFSIPFLVYEYESFKMLYIGLINLLFWYILQFFMELMKVPRVESKLRVFAFKITFNTQVCYLGYFYLCLVLHAIVMNDISCLTTFLACFSRWAI